MAIDNVQKSKHHLEEAGQSAKNEAKERMADLKDEFEDKKGQAKAKMSDVTERLQQSCDTVKGYVKKNPLTALGIAAAVGMGVAALLNRSR
ncbi:MAG: C-terminal glycine zipper region [Gammaproteobacteria bacterium]|nr:C-terminal glycine zipper region [Gammaproteobacteria bacterium]